MALYSAYTALIPIYWFNYSIVYSVGYMQYKISNILKQIQII